VPRSCASDVLIVKATSMPVMYDPSASTVLRGELLRKLGRKGEHDQAIRESINAVFRRREFIPTMSKDLKAGVALLVGGVLLIGGALIRKRRRQAANRVVESLVLTIGEASLTLKDAALLDTLPYVHSPAEPTTPRSLLRIYYTPPLTC
jgi:hypothetical protein